MNEIILPYIPDEVPYVLKEHRAAQRAGEVVPVWYLVPLSIKEQAEVQDGALRARFRAGQKAGEEQDPELDFHAAKMELRVLMSNLKRVENLRGRSAAGAVEDLELPAPGLGGVAARQREAILRRMPRAWRAELAKALMDDAFLTEEEEKNSV